MWINTSEAEIQPAVSPVYELTKRMLGQLVSIRGAVLDATGREALILRKLVLGPFRSSLNPIGVMGADFVASQVLAPGELGISTGDRDTKPTDLCLDASDRAWTADLQPDPQSPRSVRISHPSLVTRTVCSHCAEREPSRVTTVH